MRIGFFFICFGAAAIGAAPAAGGAAAGFGGVDGDICAQAGAAIARAAAIATAFKRCFMPLSSVAVPNGICSYGSLYLRVGRADLGKTTTMPFRSGHAAPKSSTRPYPVRII